MVAVRGTPKRTPDAQLEHHAVMPEAVIEFSRTNLVGVVGAARYSKQRHARFAHRMCLPEHAAKQLAAPCRGCQAAASFTAMMLSGILLSERAVEELAFLLRARPAEVPVSVDADPAEIRLER